MPRIRSVSYRGLKGSDHALDLTGLDVIVGPYGVGKTSLIEAIQFAALGYSPALGPKQTWKLLRNGELVVDVVLSDGRTFSRSLTRKGTATKGGASVSWLEKVGPSEAGDAIRALFAKTALEAEENLHLKALLDATPNQRAARIEALLDASALPADVRASRGRALMIADLAEVPVQRLPQDPAALEVMVASLMSTLPHVDVVREVSEALTLRLQESLQVALERANEEKRRYTADAGDQVKARSVLENRLAALGPIEVAASVQERRDAAASKRAAATRDLEEGAKALRIRAEVGQKLPALETAAVDAMRARREAEAALPRATQARLEAEAIVDPEAPPAPDAVEPDAALIGRADGLDAQAGAAQEEGRAIQIPDPVSALAEQAAVDHATRALALAEKSPWREVEAIADGLAPLALALYGDEPAEGKALDAAAEQLRALATEHGGDRDALASALDRARVELAAATEQQARRAAERQEATARWQELLRRSAELREQAGTVRASALAEAASINAENRRVYLEAAGAHAQLVASNRAQRDRLLQEAAYLESSAQAAETALAKATADLQEVKARLDGIVSVSVDIDAAQKVVDETTVEIAALDSKLVALREADACRRVMTEEIATIDRATALGKAWKAAENACKALRAEDLAARAKGLEGRERVFLAAAGRTEEPFLRAEKGDTSFGWVRGAQPIFVETLSGHESTLFCAGLAAGVISLRGAEVKALLIEADQSGEPDGKLSPSLLRGLEAVVAEGWIDSVIVCTNRPVDVGQAWSVHRLEPAMAEVGA